MSTTLDLRWQELCERQVAHDVAHREKEEIHKACALLVDARDMAGRSDSREVRISGPE